ncbi:MAG: hypothetical protein ACK4MM_07445 [Fervidobacterium sp.]
MIFFFFIFMILLNFPLVESQIYINCTVTTTCPDVDVFHISDLTDAHAELNTQNNYQYKVCCKATGTTLSVSNEISGGIIGLSYPTDAHAEIGNQMNYGYHLKLNPGTGYMRCDFLNSCDGYETCIVSLSGFTDAHVGDCVTNPYQTKICCNIETLNLTLNMNSTKVSWNDGIKVYGKAMRSGLPLDSSNVTIKFDDKIYCFLQTNSTGDYECSFTIPKKRIANYNITATVVDKDTLDEKTESRTFKTYLYYGYQISKNDMSCYETPRVIQNPDGSVDIVMVNVCVWK